MPEQNPGEAYAYRNTVGDMPDDTISLMPIIRTLWEYRKVITIALAAVLAVIVIVGIVLYLILPAQKLATLEFRLEFEGADKGEYPNGTKFSSSEIVSTPVLTQVYESNDLKQYMPFEKFKKSVFIIETNPELELLEQEYKARLSDVKLSPVDRDRIEKEYEKKRESLFVPQYSLNLARKEYATSMPPVLASKVLNDILATWAENAAQKGALKYRIPVYSRNIINKEFIEAEDYIVAVDILRSKINRIVENIDKISALPGAEVIRTGEQRISLAEIRANLEDILRFKLQPLVWMIRSGGLSKNPRLSILYLENQLFQIKLDREEAGGKVKTFEDSLRGYMQDKVSIASAPASGTAKGRGPIAGGTGDMNIPALIPQFGESFLDRLIELATQNNDVKFRQDITERIIDGGLKKVSLEKETKYYEDLIASLQGLVRQGRALSEEDRKQLVGLIKARYEEIINDIIKSLDQVNGVYQQLSAQNLNPRTLLYTVTAPASLKTQHSFSLYKFALYGVLFFIFSTTIILFACLTYDRFREQSSLEVKHQYTEAAVQRSTNA